MKRETRALIEDVGITAASLIQTFGDQAYHKGCAMVAEAMRVGDREACRHLANANFVLMGRGYHKHPREDRKP